MTKYRCNAPSVESMLGLCIDHIPKNKVTKTKDLTRIMPLNLIFVVILSENAVYKFKTILGYPMQRYDTLREYFGVFQYD